MTGEEELKVLKEIKAYTHVIAADVLREKAGQIIDSYEKARAYQCLDGAKSDSAIAVLIGVPRRTVTSWVAEFAHLGLTTTEERFETALFTLEELGVSLRSLKPKSRKSEPLSDKEPDSENTMREEEDVDQRKDQGMPGHDERRTENQN